MPSRSLDAAFDRLRIALGQHDDVGLPDERLLAKFLSERDQTAFAIIVRRHAAMIMGVCRRILRHRHDAEDAFQATFLVLARKAAKITQPELLAHWLYRVAYKTALKAYAVGRKRRSREASARDACEPATHAPTSRHDLAPFLDQEVNRLPEKYRVPIILCDLEGKTQKKAAALLGCPEKTLSSRLARGREMLAKRLARLGLVATAISLPAALAQNAALAAPALIGSTVKAASLLATGPAASGAVSANVLALTEGVIHAMFFKNIKVVCTALLVLGFTGYGGAKLTVLMGEGPGGTVLAQGSGQGEKKKEGPAKQGNDGKQTDNNKLQSKADVGVGENKNELFVYRAVYVPAGEACAMAQMLFPGSKMRIVIDERTNTLMVNGTPTNITQVKAVLRAMDIGTIPFQIDVPRHESPQTSVEIDKELEKAREHYDDLKKYGPFFLRLIMADPNNHSAILQQPSIRDVHVRIDDEKSNSFQSFSKTGDPLANVYVLRVDKRDVYIQIRNDIYALHIGLTVEKALEKALTSQELKRLDLEKLRRPPDPKKEQAVLENASIEYRLKKAKEMGPDYYRLKLAEANIEVEMLSALVVRMREFERTQKLFDEGTLSKDDMNAVTIALEKAKRQYRQFEGY